MDTEPIIYDDSSPYLVKLQPKMPIVFEPVEIQYTNFIPSEPLVNSLMTKIYSSTTLADQRQVMLQRFSGVPQSAHPAWVWRWNEIKEMSSYPTDEILSYLACHIVKREENSQSEVYWVSEPVHSSLRKLYIGASKNLYDIISIMYQVSEALCVLESHSRSHQCINPDTIF